MLVVNLTEPRITWVTGIWACLEGIILVRLTEVRRVAHVGGFIPWVGSALAK